MRAHEFIAEDFRPDSKDLVGYTAELRKKLHKLEQMPYDDTVREYTGTLASEINDLLHQAFRDKKMSPGSYYYLTKKVAELDAALQRKTLSKSLVLYHGLAQNPQRAWDTYGHDYDEPIRVHLPAYTSASTSFSVASSFARHSYHNTNKQAIINFDYNGDPALFGGNHILEIQVPAGIPTGSVKHFSRHSSEEEFVLPRGLDIEISPNPILYKGTYLVWEARVVGHKPTPINQK